MAKPLLRSPSSLPACWSCCRCLLEAPEDTLHALSVWGQNQPWVTTGADRGWGYAHVCRERSQYFLGRLTAYGNQGEMPDLMNTVYFSLKYLDIWQLYVQNGHEVFEPSPSQGRGVVGTSRTAKCLWWWWWCTQGPRRQVLPGELQPFAFRGFP